MFVSLSLRVGSTGRHALYFEFISLTNGDTTILDDAFLCLQRKRRTALVGPMSCGKSIFLSALSSYTIEHSIESVMPVKDVTLNPIECLLEVGGCLPTQESDTECVKEYASATSSERAAEILLGLGLSPSQLTEPVHSLPHSLLPVLSLARSLFHVPTVLLLDSVDSFLPTIRSVRWLQEFLRFYPNYVLLTSTSRSFLDSVCTAVVSLSERQLKHYAGNYTMFLQQVHTQQQEKTSLLAFQSLQAQHYKKMSHNLDTRLYTSALCRKVNKNCVPLKPPPHPPSLFTLHEVNTIGDPLIDFDHVFHRFGDDVSLFATFVVSSQSKITLVGDRGCGHTTLFRLLCNDPELVISGGTRARNPALRIGGVGPSLSSPVDVEWTPLEHLRGDHPAIADHHLLACLANFGIDKHAAHTRMSNSSESRIVCVCIAAAVLHQPHLLLLDRVVSQSFSPDAMETLVEAINSFEGAVMMVVTDDYILSRIQGAEVWQVREGHIKTWQPRAYVNHISKLNSDIVIGPPDWTFSPPSKDIE